MEKDKNNNIISFPKKKSKYEIYDANKIVLAYNFFRYSTVTDLAKFLGLSISQPFSKAT